MAQFETLIKPREDELLLDVGGYPGNWTHLPQTTKRIDCLNIDPVTWNSAPFPDHRIGMILGDGCSLHYSDGEYDILFSNSVIEHVGEWERQIAFANEARRVGKKLWIQTPALECPLEPHFLAPFVHWLPVSFRRLLLRWFTPWGLITKPSQAEIDQTIAFTRLLTKNQMKELFPDCTILTERLMGIFPKSYIAYRNSTGSDSQHVLSPMVETREVSASVMMVKLAP